MLVVVTVVVLVVVAVVLVLLGGARLVSPRNPLGTVTPDPHCSYGTHTLLIWPITNSIWLYMAHYTTKYKS